MMLTGRTYSAEAGAAIGVSQYLVEPGQGLAKGLELAQSAAANAPLTNFAVIQALPLIARADPETGSLLESLMFTAASMLANEELGERVGDGPGDADQPPEIAASAWQPSLCPERAKKSIRPRSSRTACRSSSAANARARCGWVGQLPVTGARKVDRKALRRACGEQELASG